MQEAGQSATSKRRTELSMEDRLKLSEGRKRFGVNNDDDALDLAENLFRMNRQVLDVKNAVILAELDHHRRRRISRANNFCGIQVEDQRQGRSGEELMEARAIRSVAPSYNEQPPFGYSFDRTKLPRLPPLKRLEGMIESCSRPFQKQLTVTDTSKSHDRLSFNKDDVRWGILPFLNSLNYGKRDLERGIPVTTYDCRGKKYAMVFKTWNNKVNVLNTVGWNAFVEDNQLVANYDWVSVWAFSKKQSGKLCFALIVKRFPTPEYIKKRSKREPPDFLSD